MHPTLDRLEQYLTDCENKRRRARDRPSNQVLEEIRTLLSRYRAAVAGRAEGPVPTEPEGPEAGTSDAEPKPHIN
jgi:hypothetical protein